jgi:hypothetical protein
MVEIFKKNWLTILEKLLGILIPNSQLMIAVEYLLHNIHKGGEKKKKKKT